MDISRLEEVVREIISSYDNRSPLPDSISYLEEKLEEVRGKIEGLRCGEISVDEVSRDTDEIVETIKRLFKEMEIDIRE